MTIGIDGIDVQDIQVEMLRNGSLDQITQLEHNWNYRFDSHLAGVDKMKSFKWMIFKERYILRRANGSRGEKRVVRNRNQEQLKSKEGEPTSYRVEETSKEFKERGMVRLAASSVAIPCDMHLKIMKCYLP